MNNNKFSQDDFIRQKQRAKELTKNIEDKIQKAREKQQQELEFKKQKNQQELEFKKKNNPEFRDYDKEPIVIKNHKGSLVTTVYLAISITLFVFKIMSLCGIVELTKSLNYAFSPTSAPLLYAFGLLFIYFKNYNKKDLSSYYLKNSSIEFHIYGNCLNKISLVSIDTTYKDKTISNIFFIIILMLSFSIGLYFGVFCFFALFFCIYFPYILFYKKHYKTLDGFLSFKPLYLSAKNEKIVLIPSSNKEKAEIREYFLSRMNLDIDNLPKNMLAIYT